MPKTHDHILFYNWCPKHVAYFFFQNISIIIYFQNVNVHLFCLFLVQECLYFIFTCFRLLDLGFSTSLFLWPSKSITRLQYKVNRARSPYQGKAIDQINNQFTFLPVIYLLVKNVTSLCTSIKILRKYRTSTVCVQ